MKTNILKLKILMANVFLLSVAFGQDSMSKIEPLSLKLVVEKGYTKSLSLLKKTLSNLPQNKIDLLFSYSLIEVQDTDYSVPTFSFNHLNTERIDLEKVKNIHYEFLYKYNNNIGVNFTILYNQNIGAFFHRKENLSDLKILDSLKRGYCKECLTTLQQYVRQNKIKDYHVEIKSLNNNKKSLASRFVWAVIVSDKEDINKDSPFLSGGTVTFIDPLTAKKADMSKYFTPPKISK